MAADATSTVVDQILLDRTASAPLTREVTSATTSLGFERRPTVGSSPMVPPPATSTIRLWTRRRSPSR